MLNVCSSIEPNLRKTMLNPEINHVSFLVAI